MMARAEKQRTRSNDPAKTRASVLDAAVGLFHRNGYAATSMQDIMHAANVSSGALHHHYATKKDLGLAVIRERVAAMVEETWINPVVKAPSARIGVTRAFKQIISDLREGDIIGCPANNLALELAYADPDFGSEIEAIFDRWRAALAGKIKASSELKGSGVTADELATLIVAAYSGAMTMAKTSQSARSLNVTLKILTRVWNSLRAQGLGER